jgi:hypothetical protein
MQCSATARIRAILVLILMCGAMQAHAQNQVINSNFNTSLANWQQFLSSAPDPTGVGTTTWVSTPDADGNPSSGSASASIDTSSALANEAAGIHQCVSFTGSTAVNSVNYGMSFQVPASTTADGGINATVEIRLFTDSACTNFIAGAGGSQGRTILAGFTPGAWFTAADANFTPPSPPVMAASAEIRGYLRATGDGAATNYSAFFDKIFLSLNGTTPVVLQSFSVD